MTRRSVEIKDKVTVAIKDVNEALKGTDINAIKSAVEKLSVEAQAIGPACTQQAAGPDGAAPGGGATGTDSAGGAEDVVDARSWTRATRSDHSHGGHSGIRATARGRVGRGAPRRVRDRRRIDRRPARSVPRCRPRVGGRGGTAGRHAIQEPEPPADSAAVEKLQAQLDERTSDLQD